MNNLVRSNRAPRRHCRHNRAFQLHSRYVILQSRRSMQACEHEVSHLPSFRTFELTTPFALAPPIVKCVRRLKSLHCSVYACCW